MSKQFISIGKSIFYIKDIVCIIPHSSKEKGNYILQLRGFDYFCEVNISDEEYETISLVLSNYEG